MLFHLKRTSGRPRIADAGFFAVPVAAVALAAFLLASCLFPTSPEIPGEAEAAAEPAWAALKPDEYRAAVLAARNKSDLALTLYRSTLSRESVVAFYAAIVHSEPMARAVLENADAYDVPPSLVVALAWEESRFNPKAVNHNKSSVDRGLFQLNSKSFPKLTEREFFDVATSARLGVAHLRWCLDLAGTEVSALAMYNAGTTRVRSDMTPKKTLDYVSRILAFRSGVDELFARETAARWEVSADGSVGEIPAQAAAEARPKAARFPMLKTSR